MNKRDFKKQETNKAILAVARSEFIKNGFLDTNTKTIAEKAGIAHGTLFLHYKTKHLLMERVMEDQLISINNQLERILTDEGTLESLLSGYLDFMTEREDFFEVLAREMPFYPQDIRIKAYLKEASARNYFYRCIQKGIENGIYKNIDIKMALTFLFGTINYFLLNKNNMIKDGSIIEYKKESIIKTFMIFITE